MNAMTKSDQFYAHAPDWHAARLETTRTRNAALWFILGASIASSGFTGTIDALTVAAGVVVAAASLYTGRQYASNARKLLLDKYVRLRSGREKNLYNLTRTAFQASGVLFAFTVGLTAAEYYLTIKHNLFNGLEVDIIKNLYWGMSALFAASAQQMLRRAILDNKVPSRKLLRGFLQRIPVPRNKPIRTKEILVSAAVMGTLLTMSSPAIKQLALESWGAGHILTPERMAEEQWLVNNYAKRAAIQLHDQGQDHYCYGDETRSIAIVQTKPGRHGLPIPDGRIDVQATCINKDGALTVKTSEIVITKAGDGDKDAEEILIMPGEATIPLTSVRANPSRYLTARPHA